MFNNDILTKVDEDLNIKIYIDPYQEHSKLISKPTQWIYLIYSETDSIGQWKIGITNNLEKRITNLKVANPNIIGYKATFPVYDDLGWKIEAGLKKYYKPFKVKGEWLKYEALTPKDFETMCRQLHLNFKILNTSENIQYYHRTGTLK